MGNVVSNLIGAAQDNPTFSTLSNVKSPEIQERIGTALADYDASRTSGQSDLAGYRSAFEQSLPGRRDRADQEVGNVDRFYSGEIDRVLGNIRGARKRATENAAQLGVDRGMRGLRSNAIFRGGFGDSSYDDRAAAGLMRDEYVRAALDDAEQQRRDFDYLEGTRLGLTGSRDAIENAYINSMLMPKKQEDYEQARLLQQLSALTNIDQANKFYGLEQDKRLSDSFAQGFGGAHTGAMENVGSAASAYGAIAGRGGGAAGGSSGGGGGGL